MSAILSIDALAQESDRLRRAGRRLVLTNGCFDLLHVGHVDYLERSRALGDALAIAINSDASVRALKGPTRPVNCAEDRARVLAALRAVDYVTVYNTPRATDVIRAVRPAIYAKGGDYTFETLDAEERGALQEAASDIHILPLVPGRSTTAIIARAAAPLQNPRSEP